MNDKEQFANHIKEFYNLPEKTKIVFFKNPLKYKVTMIEDINPTHKKIIYAKRIHKKNSGVEKIARIIIPCLFLSELITFGLVFTYYYYSMFVFSLVIGFFVADYMINLKNAISKTFRFFNVDLKTAFL